MTSPVASIATQLLPPGAACILVTAPGGSLPTELAETIGSARIFAHPPWAGTSPPDRLHLELGAHDTDIAAPRASLWPGGTSPAWRRQRRIDSLYHDGQRIGLIVLAEPCNATEILRGSADTLRLMQPAIIIDLRAVTLDERAECLGHIKPLLPAHGWTEPAPAIHCGRTQGGAAIRLRADPPAPSPVPFDDDLVCGGLHPPEFDARQGGRWTGSAYTIWFALPRPPPGAWSLRLDIADWGNIGADIPATLDGKEFGACARTPHAAVLGPAQVHPGGETVRIRLLLPRAVTDHIRWPRRIGLRIRQATWQIDS